MSFRPIDYFRVEMPHKTIEGIFVSYNPLEKTIEEAFRRYGEAAKDFHIVVRIDTTECPECIDDDFDGTIGDWVGVGEDYSTLEEYINCCKEED